MQLKILFILFASASILSGPKALAYPEFIGYGYKSCLTCHWNGHGNGPLNDYGRGVWASEIASRSLYSKTLKLEDLSAKSGFLGSKELPYWVRPHVKARILQLGVGLRSSQQRFIYYPMQFDVGSAFSIDRDNRWMFVYTAGYVPNAETQAKKSMNRFLAREYYFRAQIFEPFWLYIGKTDKVYGIRNIDHTAYNRQPLGLTQNAQTVGATGHFVQETYEVSAQYFVGDPNSATPDTEQKGFTGMVEFDPLENGRIGLSGLSSQDTLKNRIGILGVHYRQGLAKGNSVMFELGVLNKKNLETLTGSNGTFTLAQTMIKLSRGFHLLTNIERYTQDITADTPENWRLGIGTLWFPMNRFEFRFILDHGRTVSSVSTSDDIWRFQGHLHVSL